MWQLAANSDLVGSAPGPFPTRFPSKVTAACHLPDGWSTQALGNQGSASPCLYLPKLSPLPPLPGCTHICSACFLPFSVTALLLPSSACQTPHSWRELQAGRTGGAWWVTISSPGGLPGGGGALCLCRRLTLQHAPVGRVGDGVDVGWHLVPLLALVHLNDLLWVDGQLLVGVHHHAEEARVRLRKREPSLLQEPGRDRALTSSLWPPTTACMVWAPLCALSHFILIGAALNICTQSPILEMGKLRLGASQMAPVVKNPIQETQKTPVQSQVRKIPWRRKRQPTPVFLPGESHGQRSLVGYSPCGHKETWLSSWAHAQTKAQCPGGNLWHHWLHVQGRGAKGELGFLGHCL